MGLALLAACAIDARANKPGPFVYSDADDGVYIIRDQKLVQVLRDSDKLCADYAKAEERAEKASRVAAASPSKKTLQREKTSYVGSARKLMGECLNADKAAQRALAEVFGFKALDRIQKAAPFEDMVYVQLLPEAPAHFEALN